MYNELLSLSNQMKEYYITSEIGQRHLLLNTPLTVDVSTDFNIDKVILDGNKVTLVGDLLFLMTFAQLDEQEFFDIVSESSFTICIFFVDKLLSLNHSVFSDYLGKLRYSMVKLAYNFKQNINL